MRSIPLALTWEMLRNGRWPLLAMALASSVLPALIVIALRTTGALDPEDPSYIILHMTLVQMSGFIFSVAVFSAIGRPARLYALPIHNSTLVAWLFLPAAALVALHSIICWACINWFCGLDWPVVGPALTVAVGVVAVQAAVWFAEKSTWVVPLIGAIGAVLAVWFKTRYGNLTGFATHLWERVTLGDAASLTVMALVAYRLGVVGVARNRRGDPPWSTGFAEWLDRLFQISPDLGRKFTSPRSAQFWFDRRQRGWILPTISMSAIIGGGLLWLILSRDLELLTEGVTAGGVLLLAGALIGAMVLGNLGPSDGRFDMRSFLATRPMTNTQLAGSLLWTAARSVLTAWGIWIAFLGVAWGLAALLQSTPPHMALMHDFGWWYLPGILILAWTILTLIASLGVADLATLGLQIVVGLLIAWVTISIACQHALSQPVIDMLQKLAAVASGGVFILATIWMFAAALSRSLIRPRTAWISGIAWLVMSAIVAASIARHADPQPANAVFVVGLLSLAVAPLASMPLAVARNRTR